MRFEWRLLSDTSLSLNRILFLAHHIPWSWKINLSILSACCRKAYCSHVFVSILHAIFSKHQYTDLDSLLASSRRVETKNVKIFYEVEAFTCSWTYLPSSSTPINYYATSEPFQNLEIRLLCQRLMWSTKKKSTKITWDWFDCVSTREFFFIPWLYLSLNRADVSRLSEISLKFNKMFESADKKASGSTG